MKTSTLLPAPILATRKRALPPAIGWSLGLLVSLALWAEPVRLAIGLMA
jgi:hypothetical protein